MIFDPEFHRYYLDDGTEIPGVTDILTRDGIIDDRWFDDESRQRGSAVHDLCERYAHGERFDKNGRPLADLEYVNAFASWMRDSGAYAIKTEGLVCGNINGRWYGGKFDGIYEISGKIVLLDLKTGAKANWHRAQLAAYSMANDAKTGKKINPRLLIDLYLKKDGTYKSNILNASELIEGVRTFRDAIMF